MMRPIRSVALGAAALLGGCGHSPAATFLVLDQAPPTAPVAAYVGPPLRVPYLHLPVTIDRPELVRQDAAGTVRVDDFARWAAPLGTMARNTLIQDLTARLPAGLVLPPDAPSAREEVRVEATVLAAYTGSGEAALSVSYRLVRPGQMPLPLVERLTTALPDDTAPARAQAWSRLIGQWSDRIAAHLGDGQRGPSAP